jgi:hypothetical protein
LKQVKRADGAGRTFIFGWESVNDPPSIVRHPPSSVLHPPSPIPHLHFFDPILWTQNTVSGYNVERVSVSGVTVVKGVLYVLSGEILNPKPWNPTTRPSLTSMV